MRTAYGVRRKIASGLPARSRKEMNRLFTLTAIIEITTGLALLIVPSVVVVLLLGSPFDAFAAVTLGRVVGVAVLTLGVACWLARGEMQSRGARGLGAAMMIYNLGVALILGAAALWYTRSASPYGSPLRSMRL
jgi:hypothetical protein